MDSLFTATNRPFTWGVGSDDDRKYEFSLFLDFAGDVASAPDFQETTNSVIEYFCEQSQDAAEQMSMNPSLPPF
jgi:hypothetical protein